MVTELESICAAVTLLITAAVISVVNVKLDEVAADPLALAEITEKL